MRKTPVDTGFAERLLQIALDGGADEAEVYATLSRNLSVEVKDRLIDTLEKSDTIGYSLRIFKDKRLGFSYSTDPGELTAVAARAIEASKFTEPDDANELPSPSGFSDVSVYDASISSLEETAAVDMIVAMESAALDSDRRITKTRNASGSFSVGQTRIMNSKGIDFEFTSSACSAHIMAVAEQSGESQMGWDYQGSRFLGDMTVELIGRTAASRALEMLGAEKMAPLRGFVLLDSAVAAEFIGILASALSSDAVRKRKSMLAGKIGESVISPRLNLVDSGILAGKLGSRPVDAEGVATTEKTLIEKGVLRGFIYNTYNARKDNVASTGNAVRGGFTGLPGVGPGNIFLAPTSKEFSKDISGLIGMVDNGIYVTETMGMHTANPISGEYSVGVTGLKIEGGTLARPIKEAVISGNILKLFGSIVMIGDESRFYGNIKSSHLLAEDIDISG
ncbi:MAG TPA: TldD/PmbA family protein [Dissulfurispiraceae bacterium]|nr:TldD/PmbA family protein [Dissulfurispiraceae bacterium]